MHGICNSHKTNLDCKLVHKYQKNTISIINHNKNENENKTNHSHSIFSTVLDAVTISIEQFISGDLSLFIKNSISTFPSIFAELVIRTTSPGSRGSPLRSSSTAAALISFVVFQLAFEPGTRTSPIFAPR